MKKVLSVLLALCLMLGVVPMAASAADDDFVIENGVLVKYSGPGGDVAIPKGVTSIGEKAFSDSDTLLSVSIPEGVTSIGSMAFAFCTSLKEVSLPSTLKIIGSSSFRNTRLTRLDIPDGVTTIESGAISMTWTLTSVTIPNSVTSIGNYAFEMLSNLTTITLPEGLTTISKGMFYASEDLESVYIPASVTKIEEYAFHSGSEFGYALKDIYFGGTEEQWKKIDISSTGNKRLTEAVVHYAKEPTKPSEPTVGGFTDVKAGAFYADAVKWAVEKGITAGKGSKNTFKPNDTCSRGEIVTFLWRGAGSPEPTSDANPFVDVKEGAFYYKAVLWAVENKITSGRGEKTFDPAGECSRSEAVTFMWRAAKKPEAQGSGTFNDVAAGSFYEEAVNWAVENGITAGKGSKETFKPADKCTRGEIVTFMHRGASK